MDSISPPTFNQGAKNVAPATSHAGATLAPMTAKTNVKPSGSICTGTTVGGEPCRKKAIRGTNRCAQHNGRKPKPRRRRASTFGTSVRVGKKWRAVYSINGRRHSKSGFDAKADSDAYLSSIQHQMYTGTLLDPSRGKEPLSCWAQRWLASTVHLRASTRRGYEVSLRTHVLPFFGNTPVTKIHKVAVQAFLADMSARGAAPGTVSQARKVLRLILEAAVDARAIPTNPCAGVKIAAGPREEMHFLTHHEVERLADAVANPPVRTAGNGARTTGRSASGQYGTLVRFAAYSGLRAGEIAGLRVKRVKLLERRVIVAEALVDVGGKVISGTTKTGRVRTVPIPGFIAEELAPLLALAGKAPNDFVFTSPEGGPLRHSNFYSRHFRPAVRRTLAEMLRFHDLRHTYAGFLIAEGAHPKAIMERMGHSSITVTIDRYGHLLPSLEEHLTDALDLAGRAAQRTGRGGSRKDRAQPPS